MRNSFGNFWGSEQSAGQTRQRILTGNKETKLMRAEDLRGYLELLASDQLCLSYSSDFMLGAIHKVSKGATYHYSCSPARFTENFDTLV